MTARFEKRAILMKSRNSILGRSLHSEFCPVIYVTEYRSKSLKKTARPLLSMTSHIYIRPETDYDLPTSCEPVKYPNQIWRLLSNYSKPARDYDGANVTDRIKTCAEQKINLNMR